jgi:hypothetical protein
MRPSAIVLATVVLFQTVGAGNAQCVPTDPNCVTGWAITGNNQGGPTAQILSNGLPGQPSIGADITTVIGPGQSGVGVSVTQTGPGTGLRVIQTGPGVGLRSTGATRY